MALYAISDLHLALGVDKPMDIFGVHWTNYMDKLKLHWEETVEEDDTVIIPGDISWATYLEQAVADFKFIDCLPGNKIISKGNHDYWWNTISKLNEFLEKYSLKTINFMHNNSFELEKRIICGTRGWKCPGDTDFSDDDQKIYNRELKRLELSLENGRKANHDKKIIVAMHYPPFNVKMQPSGFVDIMRNYDVRTCLYGHLHAKSISKAVMGEINGIEYKLVSADYLEFRPIEVD